MTPQPPMPPRGRGRPADAGKRAAIFAAAQALFLESGYGATSMERIAEAAQVSKLTVYRHFQSKDALFAEAVSDKCLTMLDTLRLVATRQDSALATLEAAGTAFLGLILHPDTFAMHRIIVSERLRSPELGRLFFENAIELTQAQIAALVATLIERGALAGDAAEITLDYLALLRHRPVLRLEFGLEPLAGAQLAGHVSHCANVILRAYAPAAGALSR